MKEEAGRRQDTVAIQSGENGVLRARRGDLNVETAWLLAGVRGSKEEARVDAVSGGGW